MPTADVTRLIVVPVLDDGEGRVLLCRMAPDRVAPRESDFAPASPKFSVKLPANSFTVVRVGVVK